MATRLNTALSSNAANLAYTISAGSNRCLIVGIAGEGTQTGQHTCTYGGESMVFLAEAIAGTGTTQQTVSLFFLNDAGIENAVGTSIVAGNVPADYNISAASYEDCVQTTPTNTDTDSSAAATPNPLAALDITPSNDDAIIAAHTGMGNVGTCAWAGLTEQTDQQTASATGSFADLEQATAGLVACEPTWTTQNRAAAVAVAVEHLTAEGITDVTPDEFDFDNADVDIVGVNFEATQGTGQVWISDASTLAGSANEVEIDGAINTWADALINLDFTGMTQTEIDNLHTLGPGARFIIVENDTGDEYSYPITLHRPQGIEMVLSPNTAPATTTSRLTGMTGTFAGGRLEETAAQNPSTTNTDVASNGNREDVWNIQIKEAAREVSYDFRVLYGGVVASTITQTPQLTPDFAGVTTAAGTITVIGTAIAVGTTNSTGTTTTIGDVASQATSIVFAAGTITITGDLVSVGTNLARGTITVLGEGITDATHLAQATIGFIGQLIAGGGQQSAAGVTTFIGDLAATDGALIVLAAGTVTVAGDLASVGTTNASGTITVLGEGISEGTHNASATITVIGDLSAIAGAYVFAAGTITATSDVAASGTHLAGGTALFSGEVVAVANVYRFAAGTITAIGDMSGVGTNNASGTITVLGEGISEGTHNAQATITVIGELVATATAIGAGTTGTITMAGALAAQGIQLSSGTNTTAGNLAATGIAIIPAAGTITVIGNSVSRGTSLARGTITVLGEGITEATHLAFGTISYSGELAASGQSLALAAGTTTTIGEVLADGTLIAAPPLQAVGTITFIGTISKALPYIDYGSDVVTVQAISDNDTGEAIFSFGPWVFPVELGADRGTVKMTTRDDAGDTYVHDETWDPDAGTFGRHYTLEIDYVSGDFFDFGVAGYTTQDDDFGQCYNDGNGARWEVAQGVPAYRRAVFSLRFTKSTSDSESICPSGTVVQFQRTYDMEWLVGGATAPVLASGTILLFGAATASTNLKLAQAAINVGAVGGETILQDSFNRADAADAGANWKLGRLTSSQAPIVSNLLEGQSAGTWDNRVESLDPDYYAEVTIRGYTTSPGYSYAGFQLRQNTSDDDRLMTWIDHYQSTDEFYCYFGRKIGGVPTYDGPAVTIPNASSYPDGLRIRTELRGSFLRFLVNGVQIYETDKAGFLLDGGENEIGLAFGTSNDGDISFDDFELGEFEFDLRARGRNISAGAIDVIGDIPWAKGFATCNRSQTARIRIRGFLSANEDAVNDIITARGWINGPSMDWLYQDDFNADNFDENWETGITHQISANGFGRSGIVNRRLQQLDHDTWSPAYWRRDILHRDQWAEIEMFNSQGTNRYDFWTIELRANTREQTGQALYIDWGGGEAFDYGAWIGFVRFDGPETEVYWSASPYFAKGFAPGSVIRAEVEGDTYRAYVDGVLVVEDVDTTDMGVLGIEVGVQAFHYNDLGNYNAEDQPAIDNFRAGNIVNPNKDRYLPVFFDDLRNIDNGEGVQTDEPLSFGRILWDPYYNGWAYGEVPNNYIGEQWINGVYGWGPFQVMPLGGVGAQHYHTWSAPNDPPGDGWKYSESNYPALACRTMLRPNMAVQMDLTNFFIEGIYQISGWNLQDDGWETGLWLDIMWQGGDSYWLDQVTFTLYTSNFGYYGASTVGHKLPWDQSIAIDDIRFTTVRAEIRGSKIELFLDGVSHHIWHVDFANENDTTTPIREGIYRTFQERPGRVHIWSWSATYDDSPAWDDAYAPVEDDDEDYLFAYPNAQRDLIEHGVKNFLLEELEQPPGNLSGRMSQILDSAGVFTAHGTIHIEAQLSQASLRAESCINPTATITWLGLNFSAGYTDPNLFLKTATFNIAGTVDVSAIYARGSSLAIPGELTAKGRNLPIGTSILDSEPAALYGAALAGAGTIDGQKRQLINGAFASITVYNNSMGGFYTTIGESLLKEARTLINWRVTLSATPQVDQIKFATGTITV